ncbi:hypothetical protein NEOLEDRAFT_1177064 [Neolentinus lepideus HHB14362 ss-1]|uniref:Uncharacterized protein n=1 Tax=Neolentinus lepideus HHB14362 ss-1 TaxID=1314782 RepID=A0A165TM38_9AGAM|nr:hypothetical protein NEOLEDRAFT_1177064 [Neolentinus lepideus HHB14362 ss-1]
MSRFTSTPFHKPSPFDVPRPVHPVSPPDTDSDIMGPAQQSLMSMTMGGDNESATIPIAAPVETPASRFRKISTLAYLNSGLSGAGSRGAESRERVQPRTKWLVVVVPPNTFPQEPGHLGHTLSSGPPNRLASGLLMPLFPTMYGQLAAIAKEFNFPSTTGLCLYLHVTESGFTFTPRISDESWQLLWGHLFEVRSPVTSSSQLPISGRIEFDIDLRKARWYDAWVAAAQREAYDMSVPASRAPSMTHRRGDSRTTFVGEDQGLDEQIEIESVMPDTRTMRHVPKKLSLLDRFDTVSARSASRAPSHAEISPKQEVPDRKAVNMLSPIVQEDEPKSAKKDLENRVRSWRASSSLAPTPMAATGQFSLDPVNMPNIVSLDSPVVERDEGEHELNLDDFTWSISSAGPEEYQYDMESVMSSFRVPSVHMDRRIEGSVCLTPSVVTSLGPEDYDYLYSPVSNASRLPSPDLGLRMLESAPPTPSTATSWGPSDHSLLYSPVSNASRLPSPDLGRRMLSSVPPTPSTATSWGPASYYSNPSSPTSEGYAQSVDIGLRNGGWSRPNTPSTATSWGPGWASYPASPATPYYVRTPDVGQRTFDADVPPQRLSFPYYDPFRGEPWRHVWPYTQRRASETPVIRVEDADVAPAPKSAGALSGMGFPYYKAQVGEPWKRVWPYQQERPEPWNQVWPYRAEQAQVGEPWKRVWPYQQERTEPWNQVWPYRAECAQAGGVEVRLGVWYPKFNLYPAVYPHLEVYPPVSSEDGNEKVSVTLSASYPRFSLHPAKYPYMEIYPGHINDLDKDEDEEQKGFVAKCPAFSVSVYPAFELYPGHVNVTDADNAWTLAAKYPAFSIYPALYPAFEIYPGYVCGVVATETTNVVAVTLVPVYPTLSVYPPLYPAFEIYPGYVSGNMTAETTKNLEVTLVPVYPTLKVYPAVYPHFEIYPSRVWTTRTFGATLEAASVTKRTVATTFYGVYPHLEIYPAVGHRTKQADNRRSIAILLKPSYPTLSIYRAAYPHMEIYPGHVHSVDVEQSIVVALRPAYPNFTIYPAVYPWSLISIYPPLVSRSSSKMSKSEPGQYPNFELYPVKHDPCRDEGYYKARVVQLKAEYPASDLYPALYPYFNIYPAASGVVGAAVSTEYRSKPSSVSRQRQVSVTMYPYLLIYPVVYPYFEIYPANTPSMKEEIGPMHPSPRYPVISSYTQTYPFFEIYPSVISSSSLKAVISVKLDAKYPAVRIYEYVYPHLEVYPAASCPSISSGTTLRRRRTHAELHEIVMKSKGTESVARRWRPRKSHLQLHKEVSTVLHQDAGASPSSASPRREATSSPEITRRRVSFAADTISEGSPHLSRSLSGTVSKSGVPPVPPIPSQYATKPAPAPKPSAMRRMPRHIGLPSNPAQYARPISLVVDTNVDGLRRSSLSPVTESPTSRPSPSSARVARAKSMVLTGISPENSISTLDRSNSLNDVVRKPVRLRESLVSERMKAFDNSSSSERSDSDVPPMRITLNALSQFPMPPVPKVPPIPNGRPVSRLDRSKYPFA